MQWTLQGISVVVELVWGCIGAKVCSDGVGVGGLAAARVCMQDLSKRL